MTWSAQTPNMDDTSNDRYSTTGLDLFRHAKKTGFQCRSSDFERFVLFGPSGLLKLRTSYAAVLRMGCIYLLWVPFKNKLYLQGVQPPPGNMHLLNHGFPHPNSLGFASRFASRCSSIDISFGFDSPESRISKRKGTSS